MTHQLKSRDIIALGFMTFALFVGAGNIIFPPMVGLQAGEHVWTAAIGFLITAVGLPVLTVVALAKVGGGVESLSTPIGKVAGILLAVVCYLAVGPLFATPRTATVSFEVGIAPLTGDGPLPLLIYSVIYFALVILVSLYPGKLLDTVGNFLAPLKIIALIVLAVAAIIWPAGPISDALEAYRGAILQWLRQRLPDHGYPRRDGVRDRDCQCGTLPRRQRSASVDPLHRLGWPDGRRWPDAAVPGAVPSGF